MSAPLPAALTVVDVGNSRIKFGAFEPPWPAAGLPEPVHAFGVSADETDFAQLDSWFDVAPAFTMRWLIASVNRDATARLTAALKARGIQQSTRAGGLQAAEDAQNCRQSYRLLSHTDLPIVVRVEQPQMVGIDRLLGAIAANRLRRPGEPAIVISVGSAITVNLIDRFGAFLGGAILPGIGMAARALHDFTDQLPLIAMDELLDPPPSLGTSTLTAMRSGLYYGAIGAMRELIQRLSVEIGLKPQVILTGGAAPIVTSLLRLDTMHVPHLVLGAIALLAEAE